MTNLYISLIYEQKKERSLETGDYITLITVELPKVKEDPQTQQEKWAYALKYCDDERKRNNIEAIKEELERVNLVMRIAQSISKDEQQWLEEFDALRNRLDEGQRIYNAEKRGREQGIEIGENNLKRELIQLWKSDGKTVEQIANLLHKEVSEIECILRQN